MLKEHGWSLFTDYQICKSRKSYIYTPNAGPPMLIKQILIGLNKRYLQQQFVAKVNALLSLMDRSTIDMKAHALKVELEIWA